MYNLYFVCLFISRYVAAQKGLEGRKDLTDNFTIYIQYIDHSQNHSYKTTTCSCLMMLWLKCGRLNNASSLR